MASDPSHLLKQELLSARAALSPSLLNSQGLPNRLRGHDLAEPLITSPTSDLLLSPPPPSSHSTIPLSNSHPQPQSRFFTHLPPELRTQIYRHLITDSPIKFTPVKSSLRGARGAHSPSAIPLLLTCKLLYAEALPELYAHPTWWLLNGAALVLPAYIPPPHLALIRRVTLHFHTAWQHFASPAAGPMARLEWAGTWHALARLRGLQQLDVVLYCADAGFWPLYAAREADFLAPLAALAGLRRFVVTARWPAGKAAKTDSIGEESGQELRDSGDTRNSTNPGLDHLPCEIRREYEADGTAEGMRAARDAAVAEWPWRYCLVGWEEDARREPEERLNECFPIPSTEGRRKMYLRMYRAQWGKKMEEEEEERARRLREAEVGTG